MKLYLSFTLITKSENEYLMYSPNGTQKVYRHTKNGNESRQQYPMLYKRIILRTSREIIRYIR